MPILDLALKITDPFVIPKPCSSTDDVGDKDFDASTWDAAGDEHNLAAMLNIGDNCVVYERKTILWTEL